jgi:redox-regulated HSP33 family molecular chaperone
MEGNNNEETREEKEKKTCLQQQFMGMLHLYTQIGEMVYKIAHELGMSMLEEDEKLFKAIEEGKAIEMGETRMFKDILNPAGYHVYSASKIDDNCGVYSLRVGRMPNG